MDQYGQIGPSKGGYDQDVEDVALTLTRGAPAYVVLADRLTRYGLVIVLSSALATQGGRPEGLGDDPYLFVALEGQGAYWFRLDGNTAGYVASKLRTQTPVCGEVIAEFLDRLGERVSQLGARKVA